MDHGHKEFLEFQSMREDVDIQKYTQLKTEYHSYSTTRLDKLQASFDYSEKIRVNKMMDTVTESLVQMVSEAIRKKGKKKKQRNRNRSSSLI